jgi:hypothetical protein
VNELQTALIEAAVTVAATLVPVAAALITALLVKALKKMSLTVDAQTEAHLRYFVELAVQAVEERAIKSSGADKLGAAVRLVQEKFPKAAVRDIEVAIHAELSRQRADISNQLFAPRGV